MDKEISQNKIPNHPIISDIAGPVGYRDTLEHSAQILELLEHLDLSEGVSKSGQSGLFLILEALIDSLHYISHELKSHPPQDLDKD